jgi:monoamine oxidase
MADGSLKPMVEARRDPLFDITRAWNLPDVPVLPGDEDLKSYLKRLGFNDDQLSYVRRAYANATGDSMEYISAQETLDQLHDGSAGEGDFRILDGYDCLVNDLAAGLDVRLNTVVRRVDWSGDGVRVETEGETFEADHIVITLPLGVLQAGAVDFHPALPEEKRATIHHLRMGPVIKLVYQFDAPLVPENIMAVYSAGTPPMWWSPSFGHDTDQVVWTAFASGDYARELLALGEEGALKAALETLKYEVNRPDLKPIKTHLVNWPADPFALGGYSVATPGHADARHILAHPVADKLFWAGEATAPGTGAATVHGAYSSGKRAAQEILKSRS